MLFRRTGRWFFGVSIFLTSVLVVLSSTVYAAKVTLDYMVLANEQEYQVMSRAVEAFEKENPDIDIRVDWPSPGEYYDKLLVRLASGTAPDITRIVIEQFQGLAIKGAFLDITSYVEKLRASDPSFARQWDDYIPVLLTAFRYNGRLYGLPADWNNTLIFYNSRLFDEAGIAYPSENWTTDDFVSIAQKLTKWGAKGVQQWGFATVPDGIFVNLAPWVLTFGGKILSDDWTRVELNRPEGINGLRFMRDLIHKYHVHPTLPELQGTWSGALFIEERVAMTQNGRWDVPMFRAGNPKLAFDVQHQPIGPTGARGVPFGAASLSISRTTKHPEEALKFVAFVTGPKGQAILNKLGSSLPVLKSVVASPEFSNPALPPKSQVRFIEAAKYSQLIPSPPSYGKLAPVIGTEVLKMLRGEQSPEQTALNIQTQGDIILKTPVQ